MAIGAPQPAQATTNTFSLQTDFFSVSCASRFIPNRDGLDLATSFTLLPGGSGSNNTSGSSTPNSTRGGKRKTANVDSDAQTGPSPVP